MAKRILPSRETQLRIFKSLTVGAIAFGVNWLCFRTLKDHVRLRAAFTVAYVLSVVTHYSLNRFWALRSARRDIGRQFFEYVGMVAVSYLIQWTAFRMCYYWLGLSAMWSWFFAVPPSSVLVVLVLNYRVFRRRA
ncbi:MAG: GtrA family protein [Opitutaceae bacterium]